MSSDGVFYTVQGEGMNLGVPSVFIRTSLCNLHCSWCDTPYTWFFENSPWTHDQNQRYERKTEVINTSIEDVAAQIVEAAGDCRRIVVTGGEPMLQQAAICDLAAYLHEHHRTNALDHWFFEIETNGTIAPNERTRGLINQFNISPKLANSNNSLELRDKPKAMTEFARISREGPHGYNVGQFKFVVATEGDMNEILGLVEHYKINPRMVYLMPEGRTEEEVKEKAIWLVDIAKLYGFNITTRLHILIWGAERGK
jgi:7-carboxy-7-deazaguanine synthase